MSERHPRLLIALHWLTALTLVASVGVALAREWTEARELRLQLLDLHRQLGLLIFIVTALRLAHRRTSRERLAPLAAGWQAFVAGAAHRLLYVLLIGLPLLGLAASQAGGHAVHLLGLPLPTLLARNRDLAGQIVEVHETGAWTLLALSGVHAIAALWHHYVLKDGALRRMLPPVRPTQPTA